ncbi:MAG: hypothetical protein FWE61_08020, partial [Micrococcales bacterium]|nr:hypothetical protein [Micrococcales bacterium]
MVGRITVMAIGAAGVAVAGLSVASATVWRPDDVLRASVDTSSKYVVTAPGVVEMGGRPTTITVTAQNKAPVVVAVGRDTDVTSWVGDDPHETISGMASWSTLRLLTPEEGAASANKPADPPAEPDPDAPEAKADDANPAGSDMWVAEASGAGRAELKRWAAHSDYSGRWSALVANPTGAPMQIEFAWPRSVSTPWLIPGLVLGLGAIAWAAFSEARRRGTLTFGLRGSDDDDSTGVPDEMTTPRTRREARAAVRSDPVPAVVAAPVTSVDDAEPDSDWQTAAFAPGTASAERQTAWSDSRRGRSRHVADPGIEPDV